MIKFFKAFLHLAICVAFLIISQLSSTFSLSVNLPEPPTEAPEPPEAEEHYDKCDLPYLGKDEPQPVPEGFLRMGPNSKYFILPGENDVPIKEIATLCESVGLQPAEVRSTVELMSMGVFIKDTAPESEAMNLRFSLGLNDEKEEGNFVEYDGSPMKFHAFGEGQPNNRLNTESCVEVGFHPKYQQLSYNDVDCNQGTSPVCMFKPTDECFIGSPLTLAKVNDEFELLGSTAVRDYYVKQVQYPWLAATAVCASEGFKLVDFSTGLSNNQILYDMVKKWIERNYIFQAIPFWTGARLTPVDTVSKDQDTKATPRYKFETSGKFLNDLSEWPSLVWDDDEPSDSSGLGLEHCISAILYEPYQSTGNNRFTLATTNCRLPQYPLCYKEKSTALVNETVTESSLAGRMDDFEREGRDSTVGRFCTLEDIKINLNKTQLTVEEILNLAAVSRHKDLTSEEVVFKWMVEKPWLKDLVGMIYKVPKEVCPSAFVPPGFIHIMYNLIILYYNAIGEQLKDPSDEDQDWLNQESHSLSVCMSKLQPIHFEAVGGLPQRSQGQDVNPIKELIEDEEIIGRTYYPDVVIDVFWYLYQVTVASCYRSADHHHVRSKTMWLQNLHNIFTKYFLEVFQGRWFSTHTPTDWGVILGDMDADAIYYSLQACAVAAFQNNNITELYFPRPVYFQTDTNDETFNLKTQIVYEPYESESDSDLDTEADDDNDK